MITDPDVRMVWCYGDSNTYGLPGDDPTYRRIPAGQRWTGRLQRPLDTGWYVIEEGSAVAPSVSIVRPGPARPHQPGAARPDRPGFEVATDFDGFDHSSVARSRSLAADYRHLADDRGRVSWMPPTTPGSATTAYTSPSTATTGEHVQPMLGAHTAVTGPDTAISRQPATATAIAT